jgi:hypothetical protein
MAAIMQSELDFLLASEGLSADSMAKLLAAGYYTLRRFAIMGDDRTSVRTVLRDDVHIILGLEQTITIACWEVAKERFIQQTKALAEAEAAGVPKQRLKSDIKGLRKTFTTKFGKIAESDQPSNGYLDRLLSSVEEDELEAENLGFVTAKESEEELDFSTRLATDGTLKLKAVRKAGKLPKNSEELRTVFKLMGNAWTCVALRHSNRAWLSTMSREIFLDHVDYLLGEHVSGLCSKDPEGNVLHRPSFTLLLAYDLKIRAKAFELVDEGKDFKAAMETARLDPVTKERYFTTPLAIDSRSSGSRPAGSVGIPQIGSDLPSRPNQEPRRSKKAKKGRGKGTDAKGKPAKLHRGHANTVDGKPICFKHNSPAGCTGVCRFAHICSHCRLDDGHGFETCPKRLRANPGAAPN